MAAFDLAHVLEALTCLDLELVRLQRHVDHRKAQAAGWPAMRAVRNLLWSVSAAMRVLHERVIAGSAPAAVELREVALQARIVVTTLYLAELRATESAVPREFWSSSRRFMGIVDVAVFVNRELGRVNAQYIAQKRLMTRVSGEASRQEILDLIEQAERAIDMIGADPSLASFLAAGVGTHAR